MLFATAAISPIAQAIAALYGAVQGLNEFVNDHIDQMKRSSNPMIERTGRILEGVKFGFGLGYLSTVAVMAAGQMLLGNTLTALSTAATVATLSNPIAMTCAAVGAILYGWNALSEAERRATLDALARGLDIGVELVRSIIAFVLESAREVIGAKLLKEFKTCIGDKAALFGRSLSDVTHLTVDALADAASAIRRHAEQAVTDTGVAAQQVVAGGKHVIRRVRSQRQDDTPAL
jgi:hypothetical protein